MSDQSKCLYVMHVPGSNVYKVGISNDPHRRVTDLQLDITERGKPYPLTLDGLMLVAYKEGAGHLEAGLHNLLSHRAIEIAEPFIDNSAEWFVLHQFQTLALFGFESWGMGWSCHADFWEMWDWHGIDADAKTVTTLDDRPTLDEYHAHKRREIEYRVRRMKGEAFGDGDELADAMMLRRGDAVEFKELSEFAPTRKWYAC